MYPPPDSLNESSEECRRASSAPGLRSVVQLTNSTGLGLGSDVKESVKFDVCWIRFERQKGVVFLALVNSIRQNAKFDVGFHCQHFF